MGIFPEEEGRHLESAPTNVLVLGASPSPAMAVIRVTGAFPLDIDWKYYLVLRLGRITMTGSDADYHIRVAVRDGNGAVLLEHTSPAAELLPSVNTVSTLL